jgi:purine-binding chemotaxis protein CheW
VIDVAGAPGGSFLVCRVGARLCALPLPVVEETMRPLPVDALAGTTGAAIGVSTIRGAVVPVLDAGLLLDGTQSSGGRLVTLRVGARRVALRVDAVLGLRSLGADALAALPPLLRDARHDAVLAIGTLDAELFVVLSSARVVADVPAEAGS